MKHPDALFSLIKGLSKTEKRYFKRYSLIYGNSESNYINLFKAVDSQAIHNESEIKKQFKGQVFLQQFSVTKNYLFHLVLKSMELYHQNNVVDIKIRSLLNKAILLFNRSMFKECSKYLNKAFGIATKYELHDLMLEIIRHKRKLSSKLGNWQEKYKINTEEQQSISLLQNNHDLQVLKDDIYFRYVRFGVQKKQESFMRNYLKHPLLKNENNAKTFFAKYLFWESRFFCYTILAENDKLHDCGKTIVKLFTAHPHFLEYYITNYLYVLNNFLYSSEAIGNIGELKYGVDLLVQAKQYVRSENDKIIFFYFQDNVVHYYNMVGDFEKALQYAQNNLIPQLDNYKDKGNALWHGEMVTYIAISYFGMGDYHNALKWLNKVYQEIKIKYFPDVVLFGYMFYIIVHFELKNFDLLPSLLQSIKHFSGKMEKTNPFHAILFRFFKKFLSQNNSSEELKKHYRQMKKEIENLKRNSYESEFQKRFDYLSWIESKIQNKSFAEVVKEKAVKC